MGCGLAGSPSLVPRFLRTWNQNSSFFAQEILDCSPYLHGNDLLFFKRFGSKDTLLHEQVVLVECKQNELLMGVDGRTIGVVIALAFDVQARVSTLDH